MSNFKTSRRFGGFTLVELMIASALLAMIIITTGYIFQTSVKAISISQGNSEMAISIMSFDETFRTDLKGMEHDGFLALGRREIYNVYGTRSDRHNEFAQTFRNDWIMFYMTSERTSMTDPRVIGQWSRVLYSHGQASNPVDADFSQLATDWVLLRHGILILPELRISSGNIEMTQKPSGWNDPIGPYTGAEWPQSGDYPGKERQFQRAVESYSFRRLHWYWYFHYGWNGPLSTPWVYDRASRTNPEKPQEAFFEPSYYHTGSGHYADIGTYSKKMHSLPHCGEFRIQYAMPQDITTSAINWRDPPLWHNPSRSDDPDPAATGNYVDPNYDSSRPGDVTHPSQYIPVGEVSPSLYAGRVIFAPGDKWPVLLKVNAQVFDPLDRLEGGQKLEMVVAVP